MPSNSLQRLPSGQLVDLVNRMLNGIGTGSPNPFGVPASEISALGAAMTTLAAANSDVSAAKDAYHGAVQARDAKDRACTEVAATVVRGIYANPSVTPAMIASIGLSPRSTSRAKIVPLTPTNLTVSGTIQGDIELSWERNGNPQGVIFRIEEQTSTGAWVIVEETSKARISLSNYAEGVPLAFRVVASKNGQQATPTRPVSMYGTAVAPAAPALRVA